MSAARAPNVNQSCREMTQGNDKADFRRKNQDKYTEDNFPA